MVIKPISHPNPIAEAQAAESYYIKLKQVTTTSGNEAKGCFHELTFHLH